MGWCDTDMTEWRRTKLKGDGAGPAEIEVVPRHRIVPGDAGTYDVAAIRSIDYPHGARLARVTGTDLDRVPRLKFDQRQTKPR